MPSFYIFGYLQELRVESSDFILLGGGEEFGYYKAQKTLKFRPNLNIYNNRLFPWDLKSS
jgi:hypothetical protein